MDANQRNTIVVAAVGVALLAGGIGFAVGRATAPDAETTRVTVRPTGASPTASATPLPTSSPGGVVLSTQGRILSPTSQEVRPLPEDADCALLSTPGTTAECGELASSGARTVWLVESSPSTEGGTAWSARVVSYVPDAGGWVTRLEASDPNGAIWSGVGASTVDLTGDGGQELVVGFREIEDAALSYDIVGTTPGGVAEVLAHAGPLTQGRVTFEGGLTDYGEIRPGTLQERRFAFSDGLFRATEVNEVPVASAPTSALG